MNCKQIKELLPLYAGRDLEEKRATLVTEHMQTCAACARVAAQYRESVQLTGQFAPPVFNEAVFAGMRQRVLREIQTDATPRSSLQTIASLFQPRLTWAIAGLLLTVFSLFAIYLVVNRGNDEQQFAGKPPANIVPGTNERFNSGTQGDKPADLPSVTTGAKEQRLAGVRRHERKRFRGKLAEPTLFPARDSAALVKILRVEIQTPDPRIRIIWFVQQETKPTSKGS